MSENKVIILSLVLLHFGKIVYAEKGEKQRRYHIYTDIRHTRKVHICFIFSFIFFPYSMQLLYQSSALSICHYSFAASKAYIELQTMLRTFPIGRHITAL